MGGCLMLEPRLAATLTDARVANGEFVQDAGMGRNRAVSTVKGVKVQPFFALDRGSRE